MLIYTKGNAIIVIDDKNVVNTFLKGLRARPKFNGISWSAIFKAARVRSELGFGMLRPIWTRSHLSIDVAIKQGVEPMYWAINHFADHVASRAAATCQLPDADIKLRADESALVVNVLERQVKIPVKLSLLAALFLNGHRSTPRRTAR